MAWLAVLTCRSRRRTSASSSRAIRLRSTSTPVIGADLAQQSSGPGGGELPVGAAGLQVGQQHVQAAQGPGAFGDQVVAAVAQQPEDHRLVLQGDRAQPPVVDSGRGDRAGVGQVALAGAAGAQQPGPGRQLGRHVQDLLAGGDQQLGDAAAQAAGALHRPPSLRPGGRPGQQLPAGLAGGRQAQLAEQPAVGVEGGGGQRALVGVDPDGDHGWPFVAADRRFRDGQPDFRWAHASVEPRRGGCRPQPGTLSASQPPTGGKEPASQTAGTLDATGCRPCASWPDSTSQELGHKPRPRPVRPPGRRPDRHSRQREQIQDANLTHHRHRRDRHPQAPPPRRRPRYRWPSAGPCPIPDLPGWPRGLAGLAARPRPAPGGRVEGTGSYGAG